MALCNCGQLSLVLKDHASWCRVQVFAERGGIPNNEITADMTPICGIMSTDFTYATTGVPLLCSFPPHHEGPHSWSPQAFIDREPAPRCGKVSPVGPDELGHGLACDNAAGHLGPHSWEPQPLTPVCLPECEGDATGGRHHPDCPVVRAAWDEFERSQDRPESSELRDVPPESAAEVLAEEAARIEEEGADREWFRGTEFQGDIADLVEVVDDLWLCIGRAEFDHLQPRTVNIGQAVHDALWHSDEPPSDYLRKMRERVELDEGAKAELERREATGDYVRVPRRTIPQTHAEGPQFARPRVPTMSAAATRGWVKSVVNDEAEAVRRYLETSNSAPLGYLVAQVMKVTGGRADPDVVNQMLREEITTATGDPGPPEMEHFEKGTKVVDPKLEMVLSALRRLAKHCRYDEWRELLVSIKDDPDFREWKSAYGDLFDAMKDELLADEPEVIEIPVILKVAVRAHQPVPRHVEVVGRLNSRISQRAHRFVFTGETWQIEQVLVPGSGEEVSDGDSG